MQTLFQIAVPSHRLLLGPIGIHDYLLRDAALPLFILFRHVSMGAQPATEHEANLKAPPTGRQA